MKQGELIYHPFNLANFYFVLLQNNEFTYVFDFEQSSILCVTTKFIRNEGYKCIST
jgi:hypothetical protein